MKKSLLILVFIMSAIFTYAQPQVSGYVTDVSGPLIGASVVVKGASKGTITDVYGKYTLAAVEGDVLVFSYIGYKSETVEVRKSKEINVKLLSQNQDLEEVVVIGYGTARKKDLTGAVSQVRTEDLAGASVKSFDEALGGRVAGVHVISSEGKPGAGVDIVIRGGNSITQSNSPLYVIDGFAVEDPDPSAIDPSDIASMDILKDASATAIYGSRGANGVIIINTKRGQVAKPRITYSGFAGIQQATKQKEVLSPYEYVKLMVEFDSERAAKYFDDGMTLEDYKTVQGVNWQDALYRVATMQSHNLSMNGGTKDSKYNLSLSYFDQDGVLIASGFERMMGRFSLDQRLNTKTEVGFNASYSQSNTEGTLTSRAADTDARAYLMYNAWAYQPVSTNISFDLENEEIDPDIDVNRDYRWNPIKSAENEFRMKYAANLSSNAYLNYEIMKGLTLRLTGGLTRANQKNETFYNSQTRKGKLGPLKAFGSVRNEETVRLSTENTLTYKVKRNGWNFEGMLGASALNSIYLLNGALSVDVKEESLGINGLSTGTPKSVYSEAKEWSLLSGFARAFIGYKDKYLLTATFRADGSSKFSKQNRWGYFPSGSFAWRISEEDFMKDYPDISQIKLRASWGLTGNNRVGEYDTYAQLINGYYPLAPESGLPMPSVSLANLRNTDLRWETTEQSDVGLDVAFFDSRLSITVDYYHKVTRDLLLLADLPPSSTYVSAMKNIGSVQNQGLEFTIGGQPVRNKKVTWKSEVNVSLNRSKVLALNDNQIEMMRYINWDTNYKDIPAYNIIVGQPLGQMYGYIWDGIYQIDDFTWQNNSDPAIAHADRTYVIKPGVANYAGSRPGDIKYKNIAGEDDVVDDNDRTVIGSALPKFIGGWNNTLNVGDFDLTLFMQFSVGNQILNANRLYMESMTMNYTNQFVTVMDRWTPENPSNEMFAVKGMRQANYSSRVIEDGSFLRFKTLTLGYSIPRKVLSKINIYKVRLYLTGQNLYTLSAYSGLDPEVSTQGNTTTPAFDFSAYPRSTNFLFGINITF